MGCLGGVCAEAEEAGGRVKPTLDRALGWEKSPWADQTAHMQIPHPFGGKYPTRIAWRVTAENGQMLTSYCGKPAKGAVEILQHALRKYTGRRVTLRAVEFDRVGVLWEIERQASPRAQEFLPYRSGNLWRYYHPWSLRQAGCAVLDFLKPQQGKRIRVDGKIHRVYSPQPKLKIREHIEPYKTWVRGWLG